MGITLDEIKALDKPFEVLGNGDALAENRDELNKLSADEKKSLAIRLVLECPDEEFGSFARAIEALRIPQDDENSFHSVLANSCGVKKRLCSLLDLENKQPHRLLMGIEFNEDHYNNFRDLALVVIKNKEVAIAQRLALTTPEAARSHLAQNVKNVFSGSNFPEKLNTAFELRKNVDRLLLGDKPEEFFSDRGFNIGVCLEFAGLFPSLLKDREQAIGEKLSTSSRRSEIARLLEVVNRAAHDPNNPFRLIAAAMNPKQQQTHVPLKNSQDSDDDNAVSAHPDQIPATTLTSAAGSPGFFAGLPQQKVLVQTEPTPPVEQPTDTDDLRRSNSCCGLW